MRVLKLRKRDLEYNFKITLQKDCEIWASVDCIGRKVIFKDSNYKITVDNYEKPSVLRLFFKSTVNQNFIKVGELVCTEKKIFSRNYIFLNYVDVENNHRGGGYSHRMMNCLLSILNKDVEGILTNYSQRLNKKPMLKFFNSLGGFKNELGYLEIKNPKNAI